MTFKHINFADSEVLRNLEAAVRDKEPAPIMVKKAEAEISLEPSDDLFHDIIHLAAGLRQKGMIAEAKALEEKLHLRQAAKQDMEKVKKDEGEKFLDMAHPEGDVEVAPSSSGLGKVWTEQSAHREIRKIVEKTPTGKQAKLNKILESSKVVLGAGQEGGEAYYNPLKQNLRGIADEIADEISTYIENKGVSLDEWDLGGRNGKDLILDTVHHSISELMGLHQAGKLGNVKMSNVISLYLDKAKKYVDTLNLSEETVKNIQLDYPNKDADVALAEYIITGPGGGHGLGLGGIYQQLHQDLAAETPEEKLQVSRRKGYAMAYKNLETTIRPLENNLIKNPSDQKEKYLIAIQALMDSLKKAHKSIYDFDTFKKLISNNTHTSHWTSKLNDIKDLVELTIKIRDHIISIITKQSSTKHTLKKNANPNLAKLNRQLKVLEGITNPSEEDKQQMQRIRQMMASSQEDSAQRPAENPFKHIDQEEGTAEVTSVTPTGTTLPTVNIEEPVPTKTRTSSGQPVAEMQKALQDLSKAIAGKNPPKTQLLHPDIWKSIGTVRKDGGAPDNDWGSLTNTALESAQKAINHLNEGELNVPEKLELTKNLASAKANTAILNKVIDAVKNWKGSGGPKKRQGQSLGKYQAGNKEVEITDVDLSSLDNFLSFLSDKGLLPYFSGRSDDIIATSSVARNPAPETIASRKKEWQKLADDPGITDPYEVYPKSVSEKTKDSLYELGLTLEGWKKSLLHFGNQAQAKYRSTADEGKAIYRQMLMMINDRWRELKNLAQQQGVSSDSEEASSKTITTRPSRSERGSGVASYNQRDRAGDMEGVNVNVGEDILPIGKTLDLTDERWWAVPRKYRIPISQNEFHHTPAAALASGMFGGRLGSSNLDAQKRIINAFGFDLMTDKTNDNMPRVRAGGQIMRLDKAVERAGQNYFDLMKKAKQSSASREFQKFLSFLNGKISDVAHNFYQVEDNPKLVELTRQNVNRWADLINMKYDEISRHIRGANDN